MYSRSGEFGVRGKERSGRSGLNATSAISRIAILNGWSSGEYICLSIVGNALTSSS